jgi:Uma2 family endonuclease
MTQFQVKFPSFAAYLSYSNEVDMEGRYALIDGALVELPPESRLNSTIAVRILLLLIRAGIPVELIHPGKCEVQVPVLQPKDPANRFPDLVVLREEHLQLTQKRLTITLEMPPPRLIAEVVSPGKSNQDRDYIHKRAQYAAIGVPEYWLIDPVAQTVLLLVLDGKAYRESGVFSKNESFTSAELTELTLAVEQIFEN